MCSLHKGRRSLFQFTILKWFRHLKKAVKLKFFVTMKNNSLYKVSKFSFISKSLSILLKIQNVKNPKNKNHSGPTICSSVIIICTLIDKSGKDI